MSKAVFNQIAEGLHEVRVEERAKTLFGIDNPQEDWGVVDECVRNSFRHFAIRTLRAMDELAEESRKLGF